MFLGISTYFALTWNIPTHVIGGWWGRRRLSDGLLKKKRKKKSWRVAVVVAIVKPDWLDSFFFVDSRGSLPGCNLWEEANGSQRKRNLANLISLLLLLLPAPPPLLLLMIQLILWAIFYLEDNNDKKKTKKAHFKLDERWTASGTQKVMSAATLAV